MGLDNWQLIGNSLERLKNREHTKMAFQSNTGERFDIGRVFSKTFSMIAANWLVLIGFALLVGIIPVLINSFIMADMTKFIDGTHPKAALGLFRSPLYWVNMGLGTFSYTVVQAGLLHAIIEHEQGHAIRFGDCISGGLRKFLPLLGLSILWGLAVYLGLILILVPGFILLTMWSVSAPALIAEDIGAFGVFGRSRSLTKGMRWPVFGTLMILLTIVIFILFAVQGFSVRGLLRLYQSNRILATAITLLTKTTIYLLIASFLAALYFEVRTVKEGSGSSNLQEIFA